MLPINWQKKIYSYIQGSFCEYAFAIKKREKKKCKLLMCKNTSYVYKEKNYELCNATPHDDV